MNIVYSSMLQLKLCFATTRSICVQRKSQPTLPWRTGGPVCKGKRINHVTAASEEPDNRISVRRAASQDIPLRGGLPPAPSPPTKCPQFCSHQSQYSTIPQQCVHHNISSALYLAATWSAIGDVKGSKVATTVRRCDTIGNSQTIPSLLPTSTFSDCDRANLGAIIIRNF